MPWKTGLPVEQGNLLAGTLSCPVTTLWPATTTRELLWRLMPYSECMPLWLSIALSNVCKIRQSVVSYYC